MAGTTSSAMTPKAGLRNPSCSLRRTGLAQGMGAGEGIVLHAPIDDPAHGREWREIIPKEICAGGLTDQADVGDRDGVTLAIAAGLAAAGETGFQRLQSLADPVADPFEPRGLIELELI